jgi:hypothetical protein
MKKKNKNREDSFFNSVAELIENARQHVGRTVDLTMCITYFEIGRMIVEEEQGGQARAEYGSKLLSVLSEYLNERFSKGFSETNLRNARKFFQIYSPSIQQKPSAKFENNELSDSIRQKPSSEFENIGLLTPIRQTPSAESYPFRLGWSHYQVLMRIKDEHERRFYEIESIKQQWSVPVLKGNTTVAFMNDLLCQEIKMV